ncbi:MAG: OB-fold domain-containing protein [Planctomycetota bacterium]
MAIGIVSYGIYLPRYRLSQKTIAGAWHRPAGDGEKAVANFDEDSLTMSVESALATLEHQTPITLFFASTTTPYREKQSAALIAAVLNLPETTVTVDVANSLRSGSTALLTALNNTKPSLIIASDTRTAPPGSDLEPFLGDGAATLLLGTENIIAKIIATHSISSDFTDVWQKNNDAYLQTGDIRFVQEKGYLPLMETVITAILKKAKLDQKDITKLIITPRDPKSHLSLAKQLGFDPKIQLQDDLVRLIGFTGTPHPFMMLGAALETAKPGDLILLAVYGDGADAVIFEVTDDIKSHRMTGQDRKTLSSALARKKEMASYTKYLEFRNLIKNRPEFLTEGFSSLAMQEREKDITQKLIARRCKKCQAILTLSQKVCSSCQNQEFEHVNLSRTGKIYTFSQEHYYPSPEPPTTMAVVDLDGGGRLLLQMTDGEAEQAKIGLPVRLTYRKMHEAGGFCNYYWKGRPLE